MSTNRYQFRKQDREGKNVDLAGSVRRMEQARQSHGVLSNECRPCLNLILIVSSFPQTQHAEL